MKLTTWIKKTLHLGNGTLRIVRVIESGKCDFCNASVSRDIDTEDLVVFVCSNLLCGHRYEVTGLA